MKVVFFDSGVGGLTVLKDARAILPYEQYVYYADSDHVPYGTKSKAEIKKMVLNALKYFKVEEVKAVVLACNTATSVAIKDLRQKFIFPIIGMEPAIKPATGVGSKKILVCATDRTLDLHKLNDLIDNLKVGDRVEKMSLQELVMFAEYFNFFDPLINDYLKGKFSNVNWNEFDSVVLGCTHFLFFKTHLRKFIPESIKIIDGNLGTVNRLQSLIVENVSNNGSLTFLRSGRKVSNLEFDHYIRYYNEITE